MKQVFDQLLKFLHEGISAIFRFVELIWTWSVDQISKLLAVPWPEWPLWKQVLLVLIIAGVAWALYQVARELFYAGAAILSAETSGGSGRKYGVTIRIECRATEIAPSNVQRSFSKSSSGPSTTPRART